MWVVLEHWLKNILPLAKPHVPDQQPECVPDQHDTQRETFGTRFPESRKR